MHAVFIPYGHKRLVETFLRDIEAQKYNLKLTSPEGKESSIMIEGQLRVLPFGFYEHIFPKEYMNEVLTTLNFENIDNNYIIKQIGKLKFSILRKMLKLKKPKKFSTAKSFFWIRQNIAIIPIGIREDGEFIEKEGEFKGWTHEAI